MGTAHMRPKGEAMRVVVLRNAGAGRASELNDEAFSRYEVVDLEEGDDAREVARRELSRGADVLVAAGGDGTLSSVADALVGSHARLAVLPFGTGNDFARTLGIPFDLKQALSLVESGIERQVDVIRADPIDGPATFVINVAAGGLSGQVDEAMDGDQKRRWGPLAYLWTAAKVLPDLRPYRAELVFDDDETMTLDAVNVVVANGRTVGGGWAVAPTAEVDDGLADVVVVRHAPALDLAGVAIRLASGDPLASPGVEHRRVRRVRVRSDPGMPFNVDGELITRAECTFTVMPRALRVLVPESVSASATTPGQE